MRTLCQQCQWRREAWISIVRTLLTIALLLVSAGACAPGQTAQVIQLTSGEAKQAAALYAEKAAVEAKIEALRKSITAAHLPQQKPQDGNLIGYYDATWLNGFVYSTDFKFIVPAPLQTFQSGGAGCSTFQWNGASPVSPNCALTGACVTVLN